MKKELLRIHNGYLANDRGADGPFFLRFQESEVIGIAVDEYFNKQILTDFFYGKGTFSSGDIYFHEERFLQSIQSVPLNHRILKEAYIISENSRLFPKMTVQDNVYFTEYKIQTKKIRKILAALMGFYQIHIPPNKKAVQLSTFERIQVELIRALACGYKLILVSGINGYLHKSEIQILNQMYKKMAARGCCVCQIETLKSISLENLDRVFLLGRGRSLGSYYRYEMDYSTLFRQLTDLEVSELIAKKIHHRRSRQGERKKTIEFQNIRSDVIKGISFALHEGEIVELTCRDKNSYTSLKKILAGSSEMDVGMIFWKDRLCYQMDYSNAIKTWQIGYVDAEAARNIMMKNLSVLENVSYPYCLKRKFLYPQKRYLKAIRQHVEPFLRPIDLDGKASALAGDQAIRVALCKWLVAKPQLLVFALPSNTAADGLGIDIERILLELSLSGVAILLLTERYRSKSEIIDYEMTIKGGTQYGTRIVSDYYEAGEV